MGRDAAEGGAMGTAYLEALSHRGDVLRGARSTLAAVARRARIAAVTNGIDRIQRARLASAGIANRFEVVVTSEGCGFAKPDPRIIHEALARLGVPAGEAVYVGDDAVADGGATRDAGVRFWWIDRGLGGEPPEVLERRIGSVREVLPLLGPSGRA
jgi:2-haloacid dehalogenase